MLVVDVFPHAEGAVHSALLYMKVENYLPHITSGKVAELVQGASFRC